MRKTLVFNKRGRGVFSDDGSCWGYIATGRRKPTVPQLFLQLEIDSPMEIHFGLHVRN